jgi:excisionase family DNA binding protein
MHSKERPVVRPTTTAVAPAAPLLDSAATAEYLFVSERMIRRLTETRQLPFVKIGRHVRFRQADLDAFIAAGRVEAVGA